MGRSRCAHRPVLGWLLGALLAFCALWPGAAGPVSSPTESGAATLVRSCTSQHIDAVAAPLRPDVARPTIHQDAATSAVEAESVNLSVSAPVVAPATTGNCTSLSP